MVLGLEPGALCMLGKHFTDLYPSLHWGSMLRPCQPQGTIVHKPCSYPLKVLAPGTTTLDSLSGPSLDAFIDCSHLQPLEFNGNFCAWYRYIVPFECYTLALIPFAAS